jgi:hypothetical protein
MNPFGNEELEHNVIINKQKECVYRRKWNRQSIHWLAARLCNHVLDNYKMNINIIQLCIKSTD